MCVTLPDLERSCDTVRLWSALWSSHPSPATVCTFLNYILSGEKEHEVLRAKGKNSYLEAKLSLMNTMREKNYKRITL